MRYFVLAAFLCLSSLSFATSEAKEKFTKKTSTAVEQKMEAPPTVDKPQDSAPKVDTEFAPGPYNEKGEYRPKLDTPEDNQ